MDMNFTHQGDQEGAKGTMGTRESSMGMPARERGMGMKKWLIAAIVIIVLLAIGYFCRAWIVAATVNGSPVSRLAVVSELEKTTGKAALDALISQKLIEQEARKKGITISDEAVDQEYAKLETQVAAQGGKLADLLSAQGMTRDDLEERIVIQKKVEALLAGEAKDITVTEEEVDGYIEAQKITLPEGGEEMARAQIMQQLKDQKLNMQGEAFVQGLRSAAKIKRFVWY